MDNVNTLYIIHCTLSIKKRPLSINAVFCSFEAKNGVFICLKTWISPFALGETLLRLVTVRPDLVSFRVKTNAFCEFILKK
jgi:hypothetical protein